jgi:hypothetical protein
MKVKLQTACGCERWIELDEAQIGQSVFVPVLTGVVATRVFHYAGRKDDYVLYREAENVLFSPSEMKRRPHVTDDNSVTV